MAPHALRSGSPWILALLGFLLTCTAPATLHAQEADALSAAERARYKRQLNRDASAWFQARRELVQNCGRCRGNGEVVKDVKTARGLRSVRVQCRDCKGCGLVVMHEQHAIVHRVWREDSPYPQALWGSPAMTLHAATALLRKGGKAVAPRLGDLAGKGRVRRVQSVLRVSAGICGVVEATAKPELSHWLLEDGRWRLLSPTERLEILGAIEPERLGSGPKPKDVISGDSGPLAAASKAARRWLKDRASVFAPCMRCARKGPEHRGCKTCGDRRVAFDALALRDMRRAFRDGSRAEEELFGPVVPEKVVRERFRQADAEAFAQLRLDVGATPRRGKIELAVLETRGDVEVVVIHTDIAPRRTLWALHRKKWRIVSEADFEK